jgi:hypothetical protein
VTAAAHLRLSASPVEQTLLQWWHKPHLVILPIEIRLLNWDPLEGFEALTCRLQEVRPHAPCALAAQMAQVIVPTALVALRLSGDPVHEPVHGRRQAIWVVVTQRSDRNSSTAMANLV